jgi:hypothetical protein
MEKGIYIGKVFVPLNKDIRLYRLPNVNILYVDYAQCVKNPLKTAKEINSFLGATLHVEKMMKVVGAQLYRERNKTDAQISR